MGVEVITFGCRLNAYESEVIRGHAEAAGLERTVVVNTCAVTAEAVRQAKQTVRRIAREQPEMRIIITGCAAQIAPQLLVELPNVRCVVGNEEKIDPILWRRTRALLDTPQFDAPTGPKVAVSDIMAVTKTAGHVIDGVRGHTRAVVQVQNGCDHRCTFCIIPYGRGNSRSVPMPDVIAQVRRLVERGTREVVLTGVDLTSYGSHDPEAPKLGALVKQVLAHAPELARLRLSSIDSVEADRDLIDAFANEPRLMPHLHLSLQAGDDMVLKRMKRRHTRASAVTFCDMLRRLRPDIVFGADIIAGFPTETEAMFARSLDLIDACGLTYLHVFPFSARPETPAAKMPQVRGDVAKERARRLRAAGAAALVRHLDREIGQQRRVLMEQGGVGRTAQFTPVRVAAAQAGEMLDVTMAGHDGRQLLAA